MRLGRRLVEVVSPQQQPNPVYLFFELIYKTAYNFNNKNSLIPATTARRVKQTTNLYLYFMILTITTATTTSAIQQTDISFDLLNSTENYILETQPIEQDIYHDQ